MIPHAVSMAAFFVDQLAFEPVILQCAPVEPESWVKWLLPTIVQTVVSLASITAGVLIAVWSFKKNRQSEHEQWKRNQKAAHEQWVLDHKKTEWRKLLKTAAEIQRVLRMETMTGSERAREIADKLKSAAHELAIASANCVFLYDFFADAEKHATFYSFLQEADEASVLIDGLLGLYNQSHSEMTHEEKSRTLTDIIQKTKQITDKYLSFCAWLRKESAASLGTIDGSPPPRPAATPSS